MITSYACGHTGRENNGGKTRAFIRVAEARNERVWVEKDKCPDCKRAVRS